MGITLVLIAILSIMVLSKTSQTMANSEVTRSSCPRARCYIEYSNQMIYQYDDNGRKCEDTVPILICKGSCPSYSGPYGLIGLEFQSPSMEPHHLVCVQNKTREVEITLSNCSEDAEPKARKFKYTEPIECTCAKCDSSRYFCESSRKRGGPARPVDQEIPDLYDGSVSSVETSGWAWPQSVMPRVPQRPAYL